MNSNLRDNDDELRYFRDTLDKLLILKILEERDLYYEPIAISTDEDSFAETEDFAVGCWELLGFTVDFDQATTERGEEAGYDLWFDPDEVTVMEIILSHPELEIYLQWARDQHLDIEGPELRPLRELAWNITPSRELYDPDYCLGEAFLATDLSMVMILETWMEWFNSESLENTIAMIEYCRDENEKRKVSQLPATKVTGLPPV